MYLRDGRQLIGVLRSYDQYGEFAAHQLATTAGADFEAHTANLVVTQSFERLFHPKSNTFGQMDRGVFLIRGENVVLLGEIVSILHQSQPDSMDIQLVASILTPILMK